MRLLVVLLCCAVRVLAVEWTSLLPQPGVARDISMGGATSAMFGPTSATSQNPAGITVFPRDKRTAIGATVNGNGPAQLGAYFDQIAANRSGIQQASDVSSLLVRSVSARHRWAAATAIFGEPVMNRRDQERFRPPPDKFALTEYQTALALNLLLHSRVQVGGRVDFYSREQFGDGEGFSYGVILKPHGLQVGLHYQRFPATGERWLHPLDRRVDRGTTASLAIQQPTYSLAFQLMNLAQTSDMAFLEPRFGAEWRPLRAVALRCGGSVYAQSRRSVLTGGIGLIDANWLRDRDDRLAFPEDVLSIAVALVYDHGRPVEGLTALTLAWRL
ncbi:MAG: hypothetical protein IPG71_05695 [bacterium]|nr:hypothetical protein [bacterium]